MKKLACLLVVVLFVSSCSSPESEGEKLAKRKNECAETYIKERQKAKSAFVNNFNASDYSSRTEALEAYDQAMLKVLDDYNAQCDEISVQKSEIAGKLANDYGKLAAFESAYGSKLDYELIDGLADAIAGTGYPDAVLAKVKTVMPVKPDADQIIKDLAEHQLTEGFDREKCWFQEDIRWELADFDIRDFNIEEVLRDNAREYIFVATMRLVGEYNTYNARAKVSYVLPDAEDWKIEFVNSMGVTIVPTHKYDDLIRCEIKDDGWGGVNALYITNNSEIELGVGVEVEAGGDKKRYTVRVTPDKPSQVGGLFGGGNVTSYRIQFVERF